MVLPFQLIAVLAIIKYYLVQYTYVAQQPKHFMQANVEGFMTQKYVPGKIVDINQTAMTNVLLNQQFQVDKTKMNKFLGCCLV